MILRSTYTSLRHVAYYIVIYDGRNSTHEHIYNTNNCCSQSCRTSNIPNLYNTDTSAMGTSSFVLQVSVLKRCHCVLIWKSGCSPRKALLSSRKSWQASTSPRMLLSFATCPYSDQFVIARNKNSMTTSLNKESMALLIIHTGWCVKLINIERAIAH